MARFNWFPGHMAAALKQVQAVIKHCNMVLEVRDARVPLSSANPKFEAMLHNKPRLIVLNKADIADQRLVQAHARHLRQQGASVSVLSCLQQSSGLQELLELVVSQAETRAARDALHMLLVVGLPNSGKSSLINALKRAAKARGELSGAAAYHKTTATGPTPGLTRQVTSFQVLERPEVWVMDTPGIMPPALRGHDQAMKLALVGAVKDSIPGEAAMVSYLLQLLASDHHLASAVERTARSRQPLLSHRYYPGLPYGEAAAKAVDVHVKARKLAAALLEAAQAPLGSGQAWHPGMDDEEGAEEGAQRLEMYYRAMGVSGRQDPSDQYGVCYQALKALRAGALGKLCFDPVPDARGDGSARNAEGAKQKTDVMLEPVEQGQLGEN